jgi:hypothetical protein
MIMMVVIMMKRVNVLMKLKTKICFKDQQASGASVRKSEQRNFFYNLKSNHWMLCTSIELSVVVG